MQGEQPKVFEQNHLTFIVYPKKIVVLTPLQAFYLEPTRHYWNRRVQLIMRMIEINEIQNLNELAEWSGVGIAWVATGRENYVAREKALV